MDQVWNPTLRWLTVAAPLGLHVSPRLATDFRGKTKRPGLLRRSHSSNYLVTLMQYLPQIFYIE